MQLPSDVRVFLDFLKWLKIYCNSCQAAKIGSPPWLLALQPPPPPPNKVAFLFMILKRLKTAFVSSPAPTDGSF